MSERLACLMTLQQMDSALCEILRASAMGVRTDEMHCMLQERESARIEPSAAEAPALSLRWPRVFRGGAFGALGPRSSSLPGREGKKALSARSHSSVGFRTSIILRTVELGFDASRVHACGKWQRKIVALRRQPLYRGEALSAEQWACTCLSRILVTGVQ